jgi:hypothetical protein
VNKLYNVLTGDFGNVEDFLEYDISKTNKVCISIKDLQAVTPVINLNEFPDPPYRLELAFKNGNRFEVNIWGEKRARNSYYLFQDQMKSPILGQFFKIPQTNKKHFSVIRIQAELQFVKLHEPKHLMLNLSEKSWKPVNQM